MTLDQAKEAFEMEETSEAAANYLDTALTYYTDDMVGFATLRGAIDDVVLHLRAEGGGYA